MHNELASSGMWYGISAYIIWGIFPLYWKLLNVVPALEILTHRIIWSFVFVVLILMATKGWHKVAAVLKDRKSLSFLVLSGFLVSLNWYTYIWAVNSNNVIETSMGYYINPFVVMMMGVFILKEKLNLWHGVSICIAFIGVLVMTVQYGRFPWIALILAVTFSLYGLSKKLVKVDSLTGLVFETAAVVPLALLYIISKQFQGTGALGHVSFSTTLTLLGAGIVTAVPLLLFATGAKQIKFTILGFIQFITPTMSLVLGIFVFKEKFTATHFLSFGFIWTGLCIFIVTNIITVSKFTHNKGKAQFLEEL